MQSGRVDRRSEAGDADMVGGLDSSSYWRVKHWKGKVTGIRLRWKTSRRIINGPLEVESIEVPESRRHTLWYVLTEQMVRSDLQLFS
jgi:hypothetical protein